MKDDHHDRTTIKEQLKKVTNSSVFNGSSAKSAFLEYVVNEALQGREKHIKAYNVAVEGLGYAEDFDPQTDSRIRVLANRLRLSLSEYYQGEGAMDPVRINLPKRGYVPVISENTCRISTTSDTAPTDEGLRIVVWPFSQADDGLIDGSISHYIGEELSTRLGLFPELSVIAYHIAATYRDEGKNHFDLQKDLSVRYVITGRIVKDLEAFSVFTSLTDTETMTQMWSRRFDDILELGSLSRFQETVVKGSVGAIGGIGGMMIGSGVPGKREVITPEIAMGMYADMYRQAPNQGLCRQVESTLIEALASSPVNATLHAMLSDVYLTGFLFGFYDDPKVLLSAREQISKALLADSENTFACIMKAYWDFSHGLFDQAESVLEQVVQKNEDDIFMVTFSGYGFFLMGQFDRGMEMITQAEKINPFLWPYNQLFYFQNHIRLGHFDDALLAADRFYIPGFFWSPLLRTIALGLLGRKKEATVAAEELLRLRPDFQINAHLYLRILVISDPILTLYYKGLETAGLIIAPPSEPFHLSSLHD